VPTDTPTPPSADDLATMPLATFATCSLRLRVWSQILDEEVWFVSGKEEIQTLLRQGVPRGKVYTAQELLTLLALPGMDREKLKRIHGAKELFGGTVQGTKELFRQGS